jgi:hypothetical protein
MISQPTKMKGMQSTHLTRTLAFCFLVLQGVSGWSREPLPGSNGYAPVPPPPAGSSKAAGCSPASNVTQLAFNNVRAIIENGGQLWNIPGGVGASGYEVPKTDDNTGPKAINSGALWMGGRSPDGQLKIAAVLYRANGNDFWPGPLTTTGDASVTQDVCQQYDRFWETTRAQAETHLQYHLAVQECEIDPDNCQLDELFPNGYSTPAAFLEWPAHGDVGAGQAYNLAPYVDFGDNPDGVYNPNDGDYPDYGFDLTVEDCKNKDSDDPVPLFGDSNIYWIFNDKGNAHTESLGQPIGLEVQAQAFAFSSNDEINNMTFYNYVVINRGSQTLEDTYFGNYVDADLGCSNDDFAGCDVERGLGFIYNWDDNDESCGASGIGYGGPNPPPPAIGVDFFEGPYQDADGIDNPLTLDCQLAQEQHGIPYKGIGIGYGDDVVDNERFGMRAYIYFNREGNQNMTDPAQAIQFYNYLRSIWKNGVVQSYGGNGYNESPTAIRAYYMFPWSSDPVGWGTDCVPQADWREINQTPAQPDRRFVQSAGPFTLLPGAFNNVTVGVVWARASNGNATTSVELMRIADDKAQALFDNCFKILDGPDAPDIAIQELDRELILYLVNPEGSNNENEAYLEFDPIIPEADTANNPFDQYYRFQGYKVYQLKNSTVSVSDIDDVELARLIYQADVQDGVSQIVNFEFDPEINMTVPREMVNGANEGIQHAIRVTQDAFAQGDPTLVNFKSYYFLAIAYGYNNYAPYEMATGFGQAFSYLPGRKAAFGAIRSYVGIPHKPAPAEGGTIQTAAFGDRVAITREEGQGNGGNILELNQASANAVFEGPEYREDIITYVPGRGPIDVKVVDPLAVPDARFEVWFNDTATTGDLNDATWEIRMLDANNTVVETIASDRAIDYKYEQLLLDWGLSITIGQTEYTGTGVYEFTTPIGLGIMEFADPAKAWLTGIPDNEGIVPGNWIRSGTFTSEDDPAYNDRPLKDDDQLYEDILGGTWAPWALAGWANFQPSNQQQMSLSQGISTLASASLISQTPSVQIMITGDKSKWTRSVVLEMEANDDLTEGGAQKLELRASGSVDKFGRRVGDAGVNEAEATLNGEQPTGAGWFPGYAIDLETGERLNIAFGENSFWGGERGRDMQWNPDTTLFTAAGEPYFGGSHWIYVFKNQRRIEDNEDRVGIYDEGRYIHEKLTSGTSPELRNVFRSVAWVGSAMVAPGRQFLESDVKILLNVEKPYASYVDWEGRPESTPAPSTARNGGLPLYSFSTRDLATQTNVATVAESSLDIINIVPNPYYAFSGYETNRLDNRVKFINLPQTCTISIYNVSGTLVRKFRKDNDLTYLDWDLRNANNIPIAGGVYICHIDVPNVGEKVLKWFGVMRPVDLQNF